MSQGGSGDIGGGGGGTSGIWGQTGRSPQYLEKLPEIGKRPVRPRVSQIEPGAPGLSPSFVEAFRNIWVTSRLSPSFPSFRVSSPSFLGSVHGLTYGAAGVGGPTISMLRA